jgi:hypothetical protein
VLAAHTSFLNRTNQDQFPGVRRVFLGFNLVVTGILGFTALVLAFQALFARGSSGELGRLAGAMVVVYGGAWSWLGYTFGRLVLDPGTGSPPHAAPPHAAPPAAPPVETPHGLPALGGGSFPPIEPGSRGGSQG